MITINNRSIGSDFPPYIVAEISANHDGDIRKAKDLIIAAKECGADAVKIQSYTANTMTLNSNKPDFQIKHGLWKGRTLYDLYNAAHTPFEWHQELFDYAKKAQICLFSTPFDETSVSLLSQLDTPAYKIASFEITDLPLLECVAKQGKPVLMSTGMASPTEIGQALKVLMAGGNEEILLFHCVSSYPVKLKDTNLDILRNLKETYSVEVGLSDHSLGNEAAIAAIALGASMIEKHFTLDKSSGGEDSAFSIEPRDFKKLTSVCKEIWESLRVKKWKRNESELQNKAFRRSIYFSKSLKKGEKITENSIKRIRPGYAISPRYFNQLIGKRVTKDVELGDRVEWEVID